MIKSSQHLVPFVQLAHEDYVQPWLLGYSEHLDSYCAWSTCDGPGQFKTKTSIDALRRLYTWFTSKGYKLTKTWQDNIDGHLSHLCYDARVTEQEVR